MYVVCILFVVIVLPITCYRLRGCMWYEKRKEHMVRLLLRQKMWEAKNPEEAAKRAEAAEKVEAARAASKRGVTFRRGDGAEPSSSALVAPVPPPARPPPQQMRQPPPPPPPAAMYAADEEAGTAGAAPPAKGGAFSRMRNAFGGGGPRPAARMQTPIGGDVAGRGVAPAAAVHDEYTDDDDYSGSEYTESTFTGVTQSQTATSVGASLPPARPAGRGK